MLKYLLTLTIALVLLFNPLNFVLLAEEGVAKDIQMLQRIGMLKGPESGVTEEYLKSKVKRCQAAIMLVRLSGNESIIDVYEGKGNFVDADLVDKKTAKYLSFLYDHPELGMRGIGNNKFDPNSDITAKDYYKIMLHALGYKAGSDKIIGDFEYKKTLLFAQTKGLSKVASANPFTVNDIAIATVETLKADLKGTEKSLVDILVDKKIIDPYLIMERY